MIHLCGVVTSSLKRRSRNQERAGALTLSVVKGGAREQWQKVDLNPISNPISNPILNPIPNPIPNPILNPIPNPNLIPIPKKDGGVEFNSFQDSINPNSKKVSGPEFDSHPRQYNS